MIAAYVFELAACDAGAGECNDTVTPFGMAELFLLVLACGAVVGVSLVVARRDLEPPTRSFAVVAATIVIAFALWQMHDPEIPFGSDEAVLLAVAVASAVVGGLRRNRRP